MEPGPKFGTLWDQHRRCNWSSQLAGHQKPTEKPQPQRSVHRGTCLKFTWCAVAFDCHGMTLPFSRKPIRRARNRVHYPAPGRTRTGRIDRVILWWWGRGGWGRRRRKRNQDWSRSGECQWTGWETTNQGDQCLSWREAVFAQNRKGEHYWCCSETPVPLAKLWHFCLRIFYRLLSFRMAMSLQWLRVKLFWFTWTNDDFCYLKEKFVVGACISNLSRVWYVPVVIQSGWPVLVVCSSLYQGKFCAFRHCNFILEEFYSHRADTVIREILC